MICSVIRGCGSMKVRIIYQSTHGNNRMVAKHVRNAMMLMGHDVESYNVHDVTPQEVSDSDLLLFTAPTHIQRAPRKIRSFLRRLAKVGVDGDFALIATRLPDDSKLPRARTLEMMEESFNGSGARMLGGLELISLDMRGPLEEGWEGRVDAFLAGIMVGPR